MKKLNLLLLIFFLLSLNSKAQSDFIVFINGDSLGGIMILTYPTEVVPDKKSKSISVPMEKRDMLITYKNSQNIESKAMMHLVDHYSVNGVVKKAYHRRAIPYKNNIVTFEKVIEMPGYTKDQLYLKAKEWIVNYYKISNTNLTAQLNENWEKGYLVMFSACSFPEKCTSSSSFYLFYKLEIQVKDGKAKISLSNFWYNFEYYSISYSSTIKKDLTAEEFIDNYLDKEDDLYSDKNEINYFYYIGRCLIFRTAEELIIPDFEKSLKENENW